MHVAGLTVLKRLYLEKIKVSDAGLVHLVGLEGLYLWQIKVAAEGAEKLRQALPGCNIHFGWQAPEESDEAEENKPDEN